MDEWPSETPEPKTSSKRRSRSQKSLPASPPLALPPAQPTLPPTGFKVQVFYLAAQSGRVPKAPMRDDLWFATYPIIPRVGDCLFTMGRTIK